MFVVTDRAKIKRSLGCFVSFRLLSIAIAGPRNDVTGRFAFSTGRQLGHFHSCVVVFPVRTVCTVERVKLRSVAFDSGPTNEPRVPTMSKENRGAGS
jgi:hypothetical protein